jgi:predicted site-specific integrase-resolvase
MACIGFHAERIPWNKRGIAMSKITTKPAVGYVRMSSDQQQDSPARQRKDIEALARQLDYRVMRWYEDRGLTGTESAKRKD